MFSIEIFMMVEAGVPSLLHLFLLLFFSIKPMSGVVALAGTLEGVGKRGPQAAHYSQSECSYRRNSLRYQL